MWDYEQKNNEIRQKVLKSAKSPGGKIVK